MFAFMMLRLCPLGKLTGATITLCYLLDVNGVCPNPVQLTPPLPSPYSPPPPPPPLHILHTSCQSDETY